MGYSVQKLYAVYRGGSVFQFPPLGSQLVQLVYEIGTKFLRLPSNHITRIRAAVTCWMTVDLYSKSAANLAANLLCRQQVNSKSLQYG
jgi:hypothetical protein